MQLLLEPRLKSNTDNEVSPDEVAIDSDHVERPIPIAAWPGLWSSYRFFAPQLDDAANLAVDISVAPYSYLPAGKVSAAEAAQHAERAAGEYINIVGQLHGIAIDWQLNTSLGEITEMPQTETRAAMLGIAMAAHAFLNHASRLQGIVASTGEGGYPTLAALIDSAAPRPGYPLSFPQLAEANGDARADMLFSQGAVLTIPRGESARSDAALAATPENDAPLLTLPGSHTVMEGEILAHIAEDEGTTVAALLAANREQVLASAGALAIPGLADSDMLGYSVYRTRKAETFQSITEKYDAWSVGDLAVGNWNTTGLFASLPLTLGEQTLTPTPTDTFVTLAQQFQLDLAAFAAQVASLPSLVNSGAYLQAPNMRVRAGETVDACCARLNLAPAALLTANACLPGLLPSGQSLEIDDSTYRTLPNDSFALLCARIDLDRASRNLPPLSANDVGLRAGALALGARTLISPPQSERLTAAVTLANSQAILELEVKVVASHTPALANSTAPGSSDAFSVATAIPAAPFAVAGALPLNRFAADFETAFIGLKLASGRQEQLWVANFSDNGNALAYAVQGSGLRYFGLPPLARNPWSGSNIAIPTYDSGHGLRWPSGNIRSFAGVDPNSWYRIFLEAVDQVLLSRDAATGMIDPEINAGLADISEAKRSLAASIASSALPLFGADDSGLSHVKNSVAEQLQARLALAGQAQTAVQFPVKISGQGAAGDLATAPFLGGQLHARNPQSAPQFRFAAARTALTEGESQFTALFDLSEPANRKSVSLALDYRVDRLQLRENSPSMSFVIPIKQSVNTSGEIEKAFIPIPLHDIPAPVVLSDQSGAPTWPGDPAATSTQWTYCFAGTPQLAVQDIVSLETGFSSVDDTIATLHSPNRPPNDAVIQALAAFISVWPAISADLTHPSDNEAGAAFARQAVKAFAQLATSVKNTWLPTITGGHAATAPANFAFVLSASTEGEPPYFASLQIERIGKDADGLDQPDDFLFLADPGYADDLDSRNVADGLGKLFKSNGFPLSDAFQVRINTRGEDWTLLDDNAQQTSTGQDTFCAPQTYRLLIKPLASGATKLGVYRQILWPALRLQGDANWHNTVRNANRLTLKLPSNRYFALKPLALDFAFYRMNLLLRQNAWTEISVVRNQTLKPGATTNGAFILETSSNGFTAKVSPSIVIDDLIELRGKTLTEALAQHFRHLFSGVAITELDSNFYLTINAEYSQPIDSIDDPSTAPPTMQVPLLLVKQCLFNVDTDSSSAAGGFCDNLASAIEAAANNAGLPLSAQGVYQINVVVYKSAAIEDAGRLQPLLELSKLQYPRL